MKNRKFARTGIMAVFTIMHLCNAKKTCYHFVGSIKGNMFFVCYKVALRFARYKSASVNAAMDSTTTTARGTMTGS